MKDQWAKEREALQQNQGANSKAMEELMN